MQLTERIFAGKGDIKADTILKHCRIINVNTKEILNADIAIQSGYIVGIGDISGLKDASTMIIEVNHGWIRWSSIICEVSIDPDQGLIGY